MSVIQKFHNFFNKMLLPFSNKSEENDDTTTMLEEVAEMSENDISEKFDKIFLSDKKEERINVKKRTLMTRLYTIEQQITVFEKDFPEKYKSFLERIERLRENYNFSLEEIKKSVTFEIDPEIDGYKIGEVVKLEREVVYFLESEVKFNIISKRLQQLIVKLNILYNVSIFHFKYSDKQKVVSQLERAINVLTELTQEFKKCEYILCDTQLKEKIISLISYADYIIFKAGIRNSSKTPDELIEKLVMLLEFDEFDYSNTFKDFIRDEISDLTELLSLVADEDGFKILKKKSEKTLTELTYSDNAEKQILDADFWNNFLDFESSLLEILKANKVEKEKVKVRMIERMNISVDESEVIVSPKTFAYLSLISLFTATHDERLLLILKLLKSISDDVTYKEIYFLALLFDVIEIIKNTPNDLIKYIEKYLKKYPYDEKTIIEKKESVINTSNKDYVFVFTLEEHEEQIITTLKSLNIDFKIVDNNIFINSFYFNGLNHVLSSLKINTENMMI